VHEDFEWDEAKSAETLAGRGFDFEFAARIFQDEVLEEEDDRKHYGERRIKTIGMIEGEHWLLSILGVGTGAGSFRPGRPTGESATPIVRKSLAQISG
jgi:uncharacterized DUF497 family protein